MVLGFSMSARRRQERAQVAHVARRRLELLEAELAGIRAVAAARDDLTPGRHAAPSTDRPPPPAAALPPRSQARRTEEKAGRLRAGLPGDLMDPVDEPWWVTPPLVGATALATTAVSAPDPVPVRRHDETGQLTRLESALALMPTDDDPLGPGRPPLRVVGPSPAVDPPDPRDAGRRRGWLGGLAGWVEDRLPPALQGRVRLSGPGVAVVLSVLGLALLAVGWTTMRSSGGEEVPAAQVTRVAAVSDGPTAAGAETSPGATAGSAGPSPAGGVTVVVDVAGKVRRPGIVTLPVGSRVHEALARAGGARPGVDLTGLNLARVLVDGEQIVVGRRATPAAAAGASTPGGGVAADGALVDLNTATAEQLDTLPGVGEVTARKILEWRSAHGTFTSVDELLEVDGIGDKTLADIKPHVTV